MSKLNRSKRYEKRAQLVDKTKVYSLDEAIDTIKKFEEQKYDETVEVNFRLGIDTRQPDQMLRSSVNLPHGTGKSVRVLCLCKGEEAKKAADAGADFVGAEEYIEKIQGGWFDFDVIVAHPDMMREVSKVGRVLGPKGLMPSPKTGTVTIDVARAVAETKKGKIELRSDKTGGLHVPCGKLSFKKEAIAENVKSVVKTLVSIKPSSSKGEYLKSISLTTSQGPGLKLQVASTLKD